MATYIQNGENLDLTAPAGGVVSGMAYVIDGLFVVADSTVAEGQPFVGWTCKVWLLPKATGYAVTEGEVLYWDIVDENFNSDSTNPAVALCVEDANTSATDLKALIINPIGMATASINARLAGLVVKQLTADGTQKAMSVSDTYVSFTEDALSLTANTVEDNDTVEWEALIKLDAMNAALLVTADLQIGSLSVDTVAITTGDTFDWCKLKGSARFTAVGASSTLEVAAGEGCNSDNSVVTRDTPTYLGAQSGPATTSDVVFKLRIKAATGNVGNLATVKNFKIKHHKAA